MTEEIDEQHNKSSKSSLPNEPESNNSSQSLFDLRTTQGQILFLLITIAISSLIQLLPNSAHKSNTQLDVPSIVQTTTECPIIHPPPPTASIKQPIYWIYGKSKNLDHLKHVQLVLQRFGFAYETNQSNWDLLWAHDYPFTALYPHLQTKLQSHQKVNHFPGCGFLTNKVDLATLNLKYIPKAFQLPTDRNRFEQFIANNPNRLFVQKHNQHRHIYVKNVQEIDFNNNETFIQEYIDRPFLVDGHRFDIGVYVIITSIDPLRVYIYTGDVLFRYCPAKYYPFDAANLDKYVVGDDYLPTWEVPSLAKYYNGLGFGMRDSFDAYVRSVGKDPRKIWQQVEDAIRLVILKQEPHMAKILNKFNSKRNFFELMRFDLILDDDLNVYLLEANMSPNLSSAHFKPNQLLYEQVIFNALNLVGIGTSVHRQSFHKGPIDVEHMISSDKNIVVFPDKCLSSTCSETCSNGQNLCNFCRPCLSPDDKESLHHAYREHIRRGDTKRIFPAPIKIGEELKATDLSVLSPKNQMMSNWFYGKCLMESSWCS